MLKNKFLYLLIFSTTLLGQEINKETLSQLEEMIMSDPATQALIVSHKGEIVLESYGEEDSREDFVTSQSIAKAFYASLFGVAIKKGLIESLDKPIKNYLSEWENDERGNITIRNLLEMKSGLYRTESWNEEMFLSRDNLAFALEVELEDKPGDIYKYNNVNTALLGPVIEEIFDASPHDVLVNEILNPIGISEYGLWKDHTLRDVTFHGIDMTPRDFVKFGELIAQDGNWDDKQLIDKNYVINSTQPISKGDGEYYGMHWAVRKIADDKKLLCMEGFNGQYLFVIPEHDLVVVKFTKYSHNRDNGYVISFGPLDYLLWLPFSWLKAIGEAFAGEEEETSAESDDGGINMPATMSQKDKFNCPNTSTDKCPPVQRIQNLVFGLTEANPS